MLLRTQPKYYDPDRFFNLQWHLTSLCEGHCQFCYLLDSPDYLNELKNELTFEQCMMVVQKLSLFLKKNGFKGYVNLIGGDPLLKKGFWDILTSLNNIGVMVGILGNPHLIDSQTADKLSRFGVGHYQLSIDGIKTTHDYFRGAGSFDRTWEAARILRTFGIYVSISMTVSQKNRSELGEVAKMCRQYGVNSFRPSRLVPQGKGINLKNEMLSPLEFKEVLFNTIKKVADLNSKEGPKIIFPICDSLAIPLITGPEGNFMPLNMKAGLALKRGCHDKFLTISSDGTIYPCRTLPIEMGNILNDSLEKVYYSEISAKLRNPKSYHQCSDCDYVVLCQGGCPAVTYALTGDPFGKDPQCWVNPVPRKTYIEREKSQKNILFKPLKIGSLETKNRIFRSATLEGMANPDGSPTEGHTRIYRNLIEGDCGLIIVGITYVSEEGKINVHQNGIQYDYLINEWQKITDQVHLRGGKIAIQLTHQSINDVPFAGELMGPSSHRYPGKIGGLIYSREMSEEEILKVIDQFKKAILRSEAAGFDGVQLQVAHSYLLGLFLSPQINLRKDQWGGSLENRLRISTEIVKQAKKELKNKEFPIMVKINVNDGNFGGLNYQESSDAIKILSASGVEAFELSGGGAAKTGKILSSGENECYFQKEGEYIRDHNQNVIMGICGGIRSKGKMEELIARGFDFISMCRPFIREPDLVKKIRDIQNYEPRCASCSVCFLKIKTNPVNCHLKQE